MRPKPIRPAPAGPVPMHRSGRGPLRSIVVAGLAGVVGIVPALVFASPAAASPGDLRITDVSASEGDSLVFELRREGGAALPQRTLNYATVAGTATAGTDFTAATGSVTFAATSGGNEQVQRVTVQGL